MSNPAKVVSDLTEFIFILSDAIKHGEGSLAGRNSLGLLNCGPITRIDSFLFHHRSATHTHNPLEDI